MATRVVSPKLLHNLRYFTRPLNSAPPSITAVSPLNLHEPPPPPPTTTTATSTDSILNLDDVKELFSSLSTAKLLRSSANLHAVAMEQTVDVGTWVMNSGLMDMAVLREIVLGTLKHTLCEHFCAGQSPEEAGRTVLKLREAGLRGMLDYGSEHSTDMESCDRNLEVFVRTVESTKSLPPSSVSFVVVKITAICLPSLLKRVSDLLRWEYKDNSFSLPWKLRTLPIFSDSSPLYHTPQKPDPLTPQEEQDLNLAHQRLLKICQMCQEANVPLMVDAEDTSIQPAIDYFTYSAAITHNKDDNPIVFGTVQAYLKDAKERLSQTTKAAERIGVPMGFKLVRGAYMSSERRLAATLGVESPIHDGIQETHACYNGCASFMLEKVTNGSSSVVLATHNVESGKLAAAKAVDLGIGKENQKLQFAQLYGMAEGLSFGLRNAGFQVSKYLPFAPLDQILPYLLRRAEENRGLLSASTIDRQLIRKELKRRLKATIL
ncbi:proline dehydrogenase 1, mitochondrial-like [Cornus florida]|uniref:proline dehydrogenase 1, mitochondrial-like n=1 Tax=Cornus florida TaxID=4283 RepID=UPI00289D112A|nr:proline dehydrogenase 1, mitochondrial-like [Cornus florida]